MNLVKWLRKNRSKAMAIVTIGTLAGFMGLGTLLQHVGRTKRLTVAYFGDGKRINTYDLALARQELEILSMLRVDDLLRAQDLRGILLAELLFSEGRTSIALLDQLRQIIRANGYRVSDTQISDIYRRSMPGNIYWVLLKYEAQHAGIRIPNDEVGELLARVIPQLFNGQIYSQQIAALVNQYGIPESQVLATVGKLLSVWQYAQLVCSTEDVTSSQIMHTASYENETINVEFVKFDSAVFAETSDQPSEAEMLEHFNKYKEFFAGDVSAENPYGFGYKLPDRVQLEYIAIKLNDVSSIVSPPTHQEMEEYYRKYAKQFTESVPEDPNDPNSPLIERTRSYADVASVISKQLLQNKINSRAESILQEARTLTEAQESGIRDQGSAVGTEPRTPNPEPQTYETVAKPLSEKHKIKAYTGQTGLLSAVDMEADKNLRRLYLLGQGRSPLPLTRVVFSVDQLHPEQAGTGLLDVQNPRIYENIGPVRDFSGEIMALIRVVKAERASAPQSLDSILDTRSLMLDDDPRLDRGESGIEEPVSRKVKEKVVEDLKKLAVIRRGRTRNKVEEFIDMVAKDGWLLSLDKFNELYKHEARGTRDERRETSDLDVFKLERLTDVQRISNKTLATLATQSEGNLGERLLVQEVQKRLSVNEAKIQSQFIDQLYSLVPQDSNTVSSLPVVLEFKPDMSFYVIRDISVKRLGQEEYEKIKARTSFVEDQIQAQSMAAVHFNPENILKRMNFQLAKQEPAESDSSDKSEEAP